jgi:hypothetical protein
MAFPTIGAFYDAILQAFQQIDPGAVTAQTPARSRLRRPC